jgi:hypothetical protein
MIDLSFSKTIDLQKVKIIIFSLDSRWNRVLKARKAAIGRVESKSLTRRKRTEIAITNRIKKSKT